MNGAAPWLAGAMLLSSSPYSCHKPTTQALYADARHCHAVYDGALEIVSPGQFERAALDPGILRVSSAEDMQSAYDFGKQAGMSNRLIFLDLMRAKSRYLSAHRGDSNAKLKFQSLRRDVNACLTTRFGSPND